MSESAPPLTWSLIEEARARIAGRVKLTPVLTSETLDALCGAQLYFKCETFQKCGAFKARGATNAVFALSEAEARCGVATHSSGNHAAALARAARLRGVPAYIVMPDNTPQAKRAAVRRYGAKISYCAATLAAREQAARALVQSTGAAFVHPYDNLMVMAGQGTVAAEFLTQVPELDVLLCPVGGGGLLSGTAVAARALKAGRARTRGGAGRRRRCGALIAQRHRCSRASTRTRSRTDCAVPSPRGPSRRSGAEWMTSSPSPKRRSSAPCASCGRC